MMNHFFRPNSSHSRIQKRIVGDAQTRNYVDNSCKTSKTEPLSQLHHNWLSLLQIADRKHLYSLFFCNPFLTFETEHFQAQVVTKKYKMVWRVNRRETRRLFFIKERLTTCTIRWAFFQDNWLENLSRKAANVLIEWQGMLPKSLFADGNRFGAMTNRLLSEAENLAFSLQHPLSYLRNAQPVRPVLPCIHFFLFHPFETFKKPDFSHHK